MAQMQNIHGWCKADTNTFLCKILLSAISCVKILNFLISKYCLKPPKLCNVTQQDPFYISPIFKYTYNLTFIPPLYTDFFFRSKLKVFNDPVINLLCEEKGQPFFYAFYSLASTGGYRKYYLLNTPMGSQQPRQSLQGSEGFQENFQEPVVSEHGTLGFIIDAGLCIFWFILNLGNYSSIGILHFYGHCDPSKIMAIT